MFQKLPRRKRKVLLTVILGGVVIMLILSVAYWFSPKKITYLPGTNKEGLTTALNRDLPEDYPKVTFTDVAASAGIHFMHFQGELQDQLPEDMGSGAAWGDYDKDGWPDLCIVNFAGPLNKEDQVSQHSPASCALYHNNHDGTFTDVSQAAGLNIKCWGMAAAWGDYDQDSWPDLCLTTYGNIHLFHNKGDGTFSAVSDHAGISPFKGFWSGLAWGDFNRDGYLDLYVCGYVRYEYQSKIASSKQYDVDVPSSLNPSSFDPERNLLFKNNRNGTFTEIGKQAGVSDEIGRSLSAVWADFNLDGWPDLYVANDISDNALYQNKGDGTFQEIAERALVADYRGAMGLAVGDWDGDADYDIFITHWIAQENALYSNLFTQLSTADKPLRELRFIDEADRYGLGQIALDFIGWGTSFFDYDNDGRPDLFVVNGSTFHQKDHPRLLTPMRNLLFWNKGKSNGFYETSQASGEVFSKEMVGRGAAFGDYDRDGDVDIFIVNNGGPAQLLRNDGGNMNHWIELRLDGVQSNTSAIGVKVRIVTQGNAQVQEAGDQGSYCSQNSAVLHFGLGHAEQVDTISIQWTTGKKQQFFHQQVNQILHIVEGQSKVNPM